MLNEKMKYLYVLASDDTDFYLENALLSISSLRMRMPNAFVSLLMDDRTEKTLVRKRCGILDLVNEKLVSRIEDKWNKKERSRWLKTSARAHIDGDFLYIDCDTVVADDLSAVSALDMELGAVMDAHTTWDENTPIIYRSFRETRRKLDKTLGFESILKTNKHFNSGVIYCRDTPNTRRFFEKWHELWLYSYTLSPVDQTPFNQTDYLFNGCIVEMNGMWNCQVYAAGSLRYLSLAKIIHFCGGGTNEIDTVYQIASPAVFMKIKESGCITDDIRDLLQSPKTAFSAKAYLVLPEEFIYSPSGRFLKKLYNLRLIRWLDVPLNVLLRFYTILYEYFSAKKQRKRLI
jgi:hypothetical protein